MFVETSHGALPRLAGRVAGADVVPAVTMTGQGRRRRSLESRQEGGSGTTESPPPPGIAPKARSARIEIPDQGSAFLWVLGLSAFSFNLGYGIVIPILEELAHRCGGTVESPDKAVAFTAMAGALMLFNFAKILGEVPGGILSDRVGDRLILGTSLLVYCVSVVLLIGARSYFPFEFARSIEGFATGISYPAMTSILLRHSPQSKLGRNMSIALGVGVY